MAVFDADDSEPDCDKEFAHAVPRHDHSGRCRSAGERAFYQSLLGIEPVECQATFAMFVLPSGLKLGLWQREGVTLAVTAEPGSVELAAALADEAALRDCWGALAWPGRGGDSAADADGLWPDHDRRRPGRPSLAGVCAGDVIHAQHLQNKSGENSPPLLPCLCATGYQVCCRNTADTPV